MIIDYSKQFEIMKQVNEELAQGEIRTSPIRKLRIFIIQVLIIFDPQRKPKKYYS